MRKCILLTRMVCGTIVVSKSVTILSFEVVYGIIVINKNIISIVLLYIRDSFFAGNLWHEHDQCMCQNDAREMRCP